MKTLSIFWLAFLCGGCDGSTSPPCFGLSNGDHVAIELLELYTPASDYAYQSVVEDFSQPQRLVDEHPSCGPDFDFRVGDVIHVTTLDQHGEDPKIICQSSRVRVDSPQRLPATSTTTGLGTRIQFDSSLWAVDRIKIATCVGYRELGLLPTDGAVVSMAEPIIGKVPPLILIRSSIPVPLVNGVCDATAPLLPTCTDQFVVRVRKE